MKKAIYRLECYESQRATEGEKAALRFILEHLREAVTMDIHTLAKRSFCSASTIVRICQKNGFHGFKELKIAILNDLNDQDSWVPEKLQEGAHNFEDEISKIFMRNLSGIKNTFELLDRTILENLIEEMLQSHTIHLFGIGASYLVAKDLQMKLERINKPSVLYEDSHLALVHAANVDPGELAIVFSYSGVTSEILRMAQALHNQEAKICSVTKYGNNKLVSMSDLSLYVPASENSIRIGAGISRIAQLTLVDVIYSLFLYRTRKKGLEKIFSSNKLVNENPYGKEYDDF